MERLGGGPEGLHQQHGVRKARLQYWPGTLMAVGLVVFIVTFWSGQLLTLITYSAMFRWLALFCMAGNVLPYAGSGLRLGMERLEWFLFNLLAVGPLLFSLLLWANYLLHGPPERLLLDGNWSRREVLAHWHEQGALPGGRPMEHLRERLTDEEAAKGYAMGPLLGVAPGLLGYDVIVEWESAALVRFTAGR
jgi:hypothetical protein